MSVRKKDFYAKRAHAFSCVTLCPKSVLLFFSYVYLGTIIHITLIILWQFLTKTKTQKSAQNGDKNIFFEKNISKSPFVCYTEDFKKC